MKCGHIQGRPVLRAIAAVAMMMAVAGAGACEGSEEDGGSSPTGASGSGGSGASGGSGGEAGLEDCAGSYSGTFDGDDMGLAAGSLESDGTLRVTFTTTAGDVNAEGMVTSSGAVSGEEDETSIRGTLDFDTCTMSGTWETTGFGTGTWTATLE